MLQFVFLKSKEDVYLLFDDFIKTIRCAGKLAGNYPYRKDFCYV